MVDLSTKSNQEIFNTVYLGLKSQGFTQSRNAHICAYRGDKGSKCAIGWLIPDKEYLPSYEGYCVDYLINYEHIITKDLDQIDFLLQLQYIHDDGITPKMLKSNLESHASLLGLSIPE